MGVKLLLALLAAALAAPSAAQAAAHSARGQVFDAQLLALAPPPPPAFDLYVLAQSWQPQFCAGTAFPGCARPRAFWRSHLTLHGLWPERERASPPSFCAGEPFDGAAVERAVGADALLQFWPNVKAQEGAADYAGFWQHEWTRHGTCSGLRLADFFAQALALERNASLAPTPSLVQDNVGRKVSTSALRAAFSLPYLPVDGEDGGEAPTASSAAVLKCVHGDALSQVFTCWEKNAANEPVARRACPAHVVREDTCFKSDVKIAAFPDA